MTFLLNLFICQHERTTRPITIRRTCYVCLGFQGRR